MVTRMPATYAAVRRVLEELGSRCEGGFGSVLDWGAGTGAASLAARDVFGVGTITAVERDEAFAAAGRELLPDAQWVPDMARELPSADLVVAAYSLGELPAAEQLTAVARAWQLTRRALVIVEPGTTVAFERVLEWRRRLLGAGAQMAAPCPGSGECPMKAPDWCHFAARVERTSLHRKLKHGALGYEDEKYCYLAMTRQPVERPPGRIVRRPEHHAGLIELTLCRGDAVSRERVAKRAGERFRAARKAEWGSGFW